MYMYYLYRQRVSWTTGLEVCRSQGLNLASWPSGTELYAIFGGGWHQTYAPEIWMGAARQANRSQYEFTDGGAVPAVDGLTMDELLVVREPGCVLSARGCCVSMTDRMVGAYAAYDTARTPQLLVRDCLVRNMFLCRGPLPPAPPPPSPPQRPLAGNVQLRFVMDFSRLLTQPGRMESFKEGVLQRVAREYGLLEGQVRVYDVFQDVGFGGATAVRVLVNLPPSINADAAQTYLFRLLNSPSLVFEPFFRQQFGISTPIYATLLSVVPLDTPPPAASVQRAPAGSGGSDKTRNATIAGVVAGVGVMLVFVSIIGYVWVKKRRAAKAAVHELH